MVEQMPKNKIERWLQDSKFLMTHFIIRNFLCFIYESFKSSYGYSISPICQYCCCCFKKAKEVVDKPEEAVDEPEEAEETEEVVNEPEVVSNKRKGFEEHVKEAKGLEVKLQKLSIKSNRNAEVIKKAKDIKTKLIKFKIICHFKNHLAKWRYTKNPPIKGILHILLVGLVTAQVSI